MPHDSNIGPVADDAAYGFHLHLRQVDFSTAVSQTIEALKTEGFGVLTDGQVTVGFIDPIAMLQLTDNPEVAKVAREARERLQRVRAALAAG